MSQKHIVLKMCMFWDTQQHEESQTSVDFNGLTKSVDIGFKPEKEHISAARSTGRVLSLTCFLLYGNSPISIIPMCTCKSSKSTVLYKQFFLLMYSAFKQSYTYIPP